MVPARQDQEERKQKVVSTGVYGFVRHPMYLGAILMFLGVPLLLGSAYGIVVGLALTLLLAGRITGEEKMLARDLEPGIYAENSLPARVVSLVTEDFHFRDPVRQFLILQRNISNVMSEPYQESILIVEDDFIVAKVIEKNLLELGYDVTGLAATGDDAVAKAGGDHPDLVLMDIHLQGETDGVGAAEKIHEMFNIPVIFLTAFSDQPTFERALVASPYGYIIKPFSRNTLATTIRVALNKKKAEQKKTDMHFWLDRTVSLLSEGIITIDASGKIILFNQAAELMTGWSTLEAYRQPLDDVLTFRDPISGDLFHYDVMPILREGFIGTIPNNSLIIPKTSPPRIIEESIATPIRNRHGEILGAVIVLYPASDSAVTQGGPGSVAGGEQQQVREVSIAFDQPSGQIPGPSAPTDAEGWYDRGNYLLFLRRFADAIDAYQNAIALNPRNFQSWFGLGTALDKLERDEEALDAYERALAIYPRNPRILDAKGVVLKKTGRDAEAERCFDLARLYLV